MKTRLTGKSSITVQGSRGHPWLLVFICIFILSGYTAGITRPIDLIPEKRVNLQSGASGSFVEMKRTDTGNVVILSNGTPAQVIVVSAKGEVVGEYQATGFEVGSASDMFKTGINELTIISPWHTEFSRFSLKQGILLPLKPQIEGSEFRPISAAITRDSGIFVINSTDRDIWIISRDGRGFPMNFGPEGSGIVNRPTRLDYSIETNRLIILDGKKLRSFAPYGRPETAIETGISNPVNIGVFGSEAWISGNGLTCFSISENKLLYSHPVDSLKSWDAFPLMDAVPLSETKIALLPGNGNTLLFCKIVRDPAGKKD